MGYQDIFLVKLSPTGTNVWAKRFGGSGVDVATAVAVDKQNNSVIVAGYFTGTVDFGGGPLTSAGGADVFVAKYAADGGFQWAKRFGGTSGDVAASVAVDGSGNVVVGGRFSGSVDFGGGTLTSA